MVDTPASISTTQVSHAPARQDGRRPLRFHIFETVRRLGETSVTELAKVVGLKRTALYFHLHQLEEEGLLIYRAGEATPGRRGKRPRYYRAASNELAFPVENDSKRDAQKVGEGSRPSPNEPAETAPDTRFGST